jgi:hypothetical protein
MKHEVSKCRVIRKGKQKCQVEQMNWIGEGERD